MKKPLAVLLLASLIFHSGGFYLMFWILKIQATQELTQKIDVGNIADSETFEINIPITLPYPLQSNGFESHSGRFEYKGEYYEMVKQKYENNVLTIVCVKDSAHNDLEKIVDSIQTKSAEQHQSKGVLNISLKVLPEYEPCGTALITSSWGWSQPLGDTPYRSNYQALSLKNLSPPPWA